MFSDILGWKSEKFLEDRNHILRAFSSDVLVPFITHLRIDDVKRFQWTLCSFFKEGS